jgi:hypothetical protein
MNTKALLVAIAIVAEFSLDAVSFTSVTPVSAINHTGGNMSMTLQTT